MQWGINQYHQSSGTGIEDCWKLGSGSSQFDSSFASQFRLVLAAISRQTKWDILRWWREAPHDLFTCCIQLAMHQSQQSCKGSLLVLRKVPQNVHTIFAQGLTFNAVIGFFLVLGVLRHCSGILKANTEFNKQMIAVNSGPSRWSSRQLQTVSFHVTRSYLLTHQIWRNQVEKKHISAYFQAST